MQLYFALAALFSATAQAAVTGNVSAKASTTVSGNTATVDASILANIKADVCFPCLQDVFKNLDKVGGVASCTTCINGLKTLSGSVTGMASCMECLDDVKAVGVELLNCNKCVKPPTPTTTPCATPTPTPTPPVDDCEEDEPVPSTCDPKADYAAVLFEQDLYDGIMHWVDGKNDECRGLNGTDIGSIRVVSKAGAHPVYDRTSDAWANNVKLVFYDNFACTGSVKGSSTGNNPSVAGTNGAKSVRIVCSGKGSGKPDSLPLTKPVALRMIEASGIKHQQDGSEGECRGLNGTDIKTMEWLASAKDTQAMSDADSQKFGVVYYDSFGCGGKRIGAFVGNQRDISAYDIKPKSLKFVTPDMAALVKQVNRLKSTNGAEATAMSAVAMLIPAVLAALF